MASPPRGTVSVHFTEAFLGSSKAILDEEDLRSIALQLSVEPSIGMSVEEVPNLRKWVKTTQVPGMKHCLWYLYFPDVPHVDVVGFSNEKTNYVALSRKTVWKIMKLATFLRLARKTYELVTDHAESIF